MIKVKTYKTIFVQNLLPLYDEMEIEGFFYLIMEQNHNLKRIALALNPDFEISETEIETWNVILEKLKLEIPIQYILGKTSFFGLDFFVDENVLIPRPETEELVDWIIADAQKNNTPKALKILDIGTGSGCIAISLKKNLPTSAVFALDISQKALDLARQNVTTNEVSVHFLEQNILETKSLNQNFDIIVSNPPYVRNLEKHEIHKNVLNNEPHLALFVDDDDALIFYKKIAVLAKKNLKPNGDLYFEINQYLGSETMQLLQDIGFLKLELRKDIYGNDRMIKASIL